MNAISRGITEHLDELERLGDARCVVLRGARREGVLGRRRHRRLPGRGGRRQRRIRPGSSARGSSSSRCRCRSSPRSTATASAAGSSSRSPATSGSRRRRRAVRLAGGEARPDAGRRRHPARCRGSSARAAPRWLNMSGERISAAQAERWGWSSSSSHELDGRDRAGRRRARGAVAVRDPRDQDAARARPATSRRVRARVRRLRRVPAERGRAEGVAAFLEKRQPRVDR